LKVGPERLIELSTNVAPLKACLPKNLSGIDQALLSIPLYDIL
jgi:hypothetical protein